jgi:hypothetical protein
VGVGVFETGRTGSEGFDRLGPSLKLNHRTLVEDVKEVILRKQGLRRWRWRRGSI